jgi:hypothetical protein
MARWKSWKRRLDGREMEEMEGMEGWEKGAWG